MNTPCSNNLLPCAQPESNPHGSHPKIDRMPALIPIEILVRQIQDVVRSDPTLQNRQGIILFEQGVFILYGPLK